MRKAGLGNGLGYFILRDGTMFFFAKLVLGVVGTTLFIVPAADVIGTWVIVISALNNPLTIVLINRLVLNLRQVSHVHERNAPTHSTIITIQEPEFAANSLLGNLGAPLRVGPEDDETEEVVGVDEEAEVVKEFRIVGHGAIIEEPRDPSDV
ncbi:hypothetical protein BD410DRAFT_452889 [Rickenella mellea]|uniref:Uncharacterized protein n=1 Tax=Rickenella mellea TaxID=50990 RepID=A0A4Y7PVQ9_9AGAM|nr:hypothetical protein BD410DRAFT_452889 [Rickenella mellea]